MIRSSRCAFLFLSVSIVAMAGCSPFDGQSRSAALEAFAPEPQTEQPEKNEPLLYQGPIVGASPEQARTLPLDYRLARRWSLFDVNADGAVADDDFATIESAFDGDTASTCLSAELDHRAGLGGIDHDLFSAVQRLRDQHPEAAAAALDRVRWAMPAFEAPCASADAGVIAWAPTTIAHDDKALVLLPTTATYQVRQIKGPPLAATVSATGLGIWLEPTPNTKGRQIVVAIDRLSDGRRIVLAIDIHHPDDTTEATVSNSQPRPPQITNVPTTAWDGNTEGKCELQRCFALVITLLNSPTFESSAAAAAVMADSLKAKGCLVEQFQASYRNPDFSTVAPHDILNDLLYEMGVDSALWDAIVELLDQRVWQDMQAYAEQTRQWAREQGAQLAAALAKHKKRVPLGAKSVINAVMAHGSKANGADCGYWTDDTGRIRLARTNVIDIVFLGGNVCGMTNIDMSCHSGATVLGTQGAHMEGNVTCESSAGSHDRNMHTVADRVLAFSSASATDVCYRSDVTDMALAVAGGVRNVPGFIDGGDAMAVPMAAHVDAGGGSMFDDLAYCSEAPSKQEAANCYAQLQELPLTQ